MAAGQLHIEAKWGEVIKEDDGGAKKGGMTMATVDNGCGGRRDRNRRPVVLLSVNQFKGDGRALKAGSDEKVNEKKKCGTILGALASDSYLSL